MVKNRRLARRISDAGFGTLRRGESQAAPVRAHIPLRRSAGFARVACACGRQPGLDLVGPETEGKPLAELDAAWVIVAIFAAVELAVSDRYGFQRDELYFLVASHHLAFGYVDQPPLAVLMARSTDIFGVNPTAIRIVPAGRLTR